MLTMKMLNCGWIQFCHRYQRFEHDWLSWVQLRELNHSELMKMSRVLVVSLYLACGVDTSPIIR